MKKEPLKKKAIEICLDTEDKEIKNRIKQTDYYYPKKEIESAVEWFKSKLTEVGYASLKPLVDEAFEDVTKGG